MMTKGKDGSEQVRIRTEYAEYIRNEGERLGKSFLSTLYWIVDNYRVQQKGIKTQVIAPVVQQTSVKQDVKKSSDTEELNNEQILDNVSEFE
jgi:hypothetical protein